MLPPLRFAADPNAPVSSDTTGSAGLPAAPGKFGAALAALFGRPAAAGPPLAELPRAPADGQRLPQGGKPLPLPEPGAAPVLPAEGVRPAVPPVIDVALELTDARDPENAEMPLLPGPLALPVTPAFGSEAAPGAAVGDDRPAPLSLRPTPRAEGVVLPAGERVPPPLRPDGPHPFLPEGGLRAQPAVSPVQAAVLRHEPAATSAGSSPSPAVPATPPSPLFVSDAVAAASLLQAAAPLLADAKELKAAPVAAAAASPLATLVATAPASPSAGLTPAVPDIAQPPGSSGWGETLGERVVWMAGHKIQNAEIRLHPAELGPLRVQISIDDGTATVHFHAHHALTRDAIEQALPRLREMLVEQGITPGNTTVSDHGASRHPQDPGGRQAGGTVSASPFAKASIEGEDTLLPAARSVAPAGLVDLFA